MSRLLVLTRYTRQGASSRLRIMQYQPYLEASGIELRFASLFDDAYLDSVYTGRRSSIAGGRALLRRLSQMRAAREADLVWLEKEALPWVPWALERLALPRHVPIVTDYDDAIFHRYDEHRLGAVRALLGNKIDNVMRRSALVTAGNAYLADRAHRAGAQKVTIVPTVVDLDAYTLASTETPKSPQRVGWIGTPQTWDALARSIYTTLLPELSAQGAVFRAVGASLQPRTEDRLEVIPWSEAEEVRLIQGMDIGVMPMPDTPWTRGKCGYKLIQYMACGLPVVAAPVGVNTQIVEHGVNGFLASTDQEWREALSTLLANPELRRRMGAAGRKKVEEHYSLQVWGPRVAELLRSVIEKPQNR